MKKYIMLLLFTTLCIVTYARQVVVAGLLKSITENKVNNNETEDIR